jgi:hypothetical protein
LDRRVRSPVRWRAVAERVVAGHLEALARTRGARDAYRTLGRTMLALARARGSIDRAAERGLARLLR